MNGTQVGIAPRAQSLRVRDQVRDALALLLFSASVSGLCALALLLLLVLGE